MPIEVESLSKSFGCAPVLRSVAEALAGSQISVLPGGLQAEPRDVTLLPA